MRVFREFFGQASFSSSFLAFSFARESASKKSAFGSFLGPYAEEFNTFHFGSFREQYVHSTVSRKLCLSASYLAKLDLSRFDPTLLI